MSRARVEFHAVVTGGLRADVVSAIPEGQNGPVAFPTTHWTLLAAATLNGDTRGRAALASMCDDYHRPIVAFLRGRGYSPEAADDFAQDFFLHLMKSAAWKRAERLRGRFRTFLLGSLMHLLAHAHEREHALKRGGGATAESLDAMAIEGFEPAGIPDDVGRAFDREWALKLVENALAALEAEFTSDAAATARFTILKRFLPGPDPPLTTEEAAQTLGVPVATAKTWVHRLRLRFRQLLRAAVAPTVSGPHEIDDELAHLRRVLARSD